MESPRELLEKLVVDTQKDCRDIRNNNSSVAYHDCPHEAIRLFFPMLPRYDNGRTALYTCRCTGENIPPLPQETALGRSVIVDIGDKVPFQQNYSFTPTEFALEVNAQRIIPMLNMDNPESLSDSFLWEIYPILKTNKLVWGAHRTSAFADWFTEGRKDDLESQGAKICDQYFVWKNQTEFEGLVRLLRVTTADKEAALRRMIIARWRNILAICPKIQSFLVEILENLRDASVLDRAHVFDGLKHLIASPVTAARGGIYRASTDHIKAIDVATNALLGSEALKDIPDPSIASDYWTHRIIDRLTRRKMRFPSGLDYADYRVALRHPAWQEFQKKQLEALELLQTAATEQASDTFPEKAFIAWEQSLQHWDDWSSKLKRAKQQGVPFLIALTKNTMLFNQPGSELAKMTIDLLCATKISKLLWKIEQRIGGGLFKTPGKALAYSEFFWSESDHSASESGSRM
jgi:hypothetical protein